MYEQYFNLAENPFTIAPNPRYFYLSDQHREALAHLQYGLNESGGFILLTGEVGTGKTTAWRCLVAKLPTGVDLAIVLNPCVNEVELLETICDELGILYEQGSGLKSLNDKLNRYLLDAGARRRRTAVIVEEAQNLSTGVLEQLRLLSNLETNEDKLLQIILIGQPELLAKLAASQLRQLNQRIIARFHLKPFNVEDVRTYINHRLSIAGASPRLFSDAAVHKVAKHSQGIPRVINLICDRALLGCFSEERNFVDGKMVDRAAREVCGSQRVKSEQKISGRVLKSVLDKRRSYVRSTVAFTAAASLIAAVLYLTPSLHLLRVFDDKLLFGNMMKQVMGTIETSLDEMPVEHIRDDIAANDADNSVVLRDEANTIDVDGGGSDKSHSNATPQMLLDEQQIESNPSLWQQRLAIASRKQDPYRILFDLWGVELPSVMEVSPCEYALKHQLDCWHRRGNINSIKRVNRPALLKMISKEGQLFHAVLKSIDQSKRLYLVAAEGTVDISEDKLDEAWTGEYTLLWKRPQNYRDTIYPGDTNQTVGWLTEQLASLADYGPPIEESSSYTYYLENRIRRLQKRCGISVDGLVGKETLIKINTLIGTPPKLQSGEGCAGVS